MGIKSTSSALSICVCAGLLCSNTYAATIIDRDIGLASPDIVIDFGDDPSSVGTVIDIEFQSSGVTFGPTYVYGNENRTFLSLAQGHLTNIDSVQPGSIFFSSDVTAAAFSWRTDLFTGTSRVETQLSAYNDNNLVEVLNGLSDTSISFTSGRYFGFENILFDEIRVALLVEGTMDLSPKTFFTLDNFQYLSAVPVPAAVWLFGSGLLGLIGVAWCKN